MMSDNEDKRDFFDLITNQVKGEIKGFYLSIPEKALLCTLVVMLLLVGALASARLSSEDKEVMIELNTLRESPEYKDILDELKELEELQAMEDVSKLKTTTNAYNTSVKSIVDKDFKALEEFNNNYANANSEGEQEDGYKIDKDSIKRNEKKKLDNKAKEFEQKVSIDKPKNVRSNSLVTYSLEGRYFTGRFPNPVYTCANTGMIVVNISVDGSGRVVEASFNEKMSSTGNRCLVDNAIEYSYRAHFTTSDKTIQKGTITYVYQ